jgi:hypothetical protein
MINRTFLNALLQYIRSGAIDPPRVRGGTVFDKILRAARGNENIARFIDPVNSILLGSANQAIFAGLLFSGPRGA